MRNLVLMFRIGLGAFALLSTAADAARARICVSSSATRRTIAREVCESCGVKTRVLFPGLYSNRGVRQTVRQAQ